MFLIGIGGSFLFPIKANTERKQNPVSKQKQRLIFGLPKQKAKR